MRITAKELQGAVKMAVRDLVREELKKLLPEVLSEMYVKRIVKESTEEVVHEARSGLASPKRVQQTPAPKKQEMSPLMRQMIQEAQDTDWYPDVDEDEPVAPAPRAVNEQAFKAVASSPWADMITEETLALAAQTDSPDSGGVPIDEVPVFDFSRMSKVALMGERKNAQQKAIDPESERQRIEMQRKKLDSVVIKG